MYLLVLNVNGKEFIISSSPDMRVMELRRERFMRSNAAGYVEIRKLEK